METSTSEALERAQAFTHRLVEFADYDKCVKYFSERKIDFDRPNVVGWSVLMSVCACGRDDLVGFVVDRTSAVDCATNSNRTTVLHLTAMSKNTRVMEELVATAERKQKLQKIIDHPNAHEDTALMMACVAKNVMAVQLLLDLGASLSAENASGLNALMCAARVGEDPRPGAPSIEEMMERSAVIVKILLTNGANVNSVEKAGGNTALHLAVLSENPDAVGALIANAPDLDITLRNEADNTALDLCKRISGVASAQMEDLLRVQWAKYEKKAELMSAKAEKELLDSAMKETEDVLGRKQAGKKKNKKSKKKPTPTEVRPKVENSSVQGKDEQIIDADAEEVGTSSLRYANAEVGQQFELPASDQPVPENNIEDDDDTWQSVLPKKTRRKEVVSENESAVSERNTRKPQRKPTTLNNNAKKNLQTSSKPAATAQEDASNLSKAVPTPLVSNKAPWSSQTITRKMMSPALISPRSQVTSEDDADQSTTASIPYEALNGSFHRTFPVAAELEIDVEKFLIASSVSDRELEPNDNLSISQVEALQEAHWQAYHYLNEKKIELMRVLEAQRVEAQFALQQELMQMK